MLLFHCWQSLLQMSHKILVHNFVISMSSVSILQEVRVSRCWRPLALSWLTALLVSPLTIGRVLSDEHMTDKSRLFSNLRQTCWGPRIVWAGPGWFISWTCRRVHWRCSTFHCWHGILGMCCGAVPSGACRSADIFQMIRWRFVLRKMQVMAWTQAFAGHSRAYAEIHRLQKQSLWMLLLIFAIRAWFRTDYRWWTSAISLLLAGWRDGTALLRTICISGQRGYFSS